RAGGGGGAWFSSAGGGGPRCRLPGEPRAWTCCRHCGPSSRRSARTGRMKMIQNQNTVSKPIRLWPGVVAAAVLLLVRLVVPLLLPDSAILGVIGAIVCALTIVLWWLFFSRAPW